MKKFIIHFSIILTILNTSCGVPQSDYDKLTVENDKLKTELDECQNGADKLVAIVEKAYSEKDYSTARENITKLSEKHPESPKNEEFMNLLVKITQEERVEKERRDAEEKERIRLENLNNTGMWEVDYILDDFGEPTKKGNIYNKNWIQGRFSNSATNNSDLNVSVSITNSSDISMKFYKYAENDMLAKARGDYYKVLMQDDDGERFELRAIHSGVLFSFDKKSSRVVHNALMKGGTLKFKFINLDDSLLEEYEFTIPEADWYDNAYLKLEEVNGTKKRGVKNESANTVEMSTKFTNKQLSGTFQGSSNDGTAATILNLKEDGTFTFEEYINSELSEKGMGKYNIVKSPVQEKDPFGKVVKKTDYWGIFFYYENEYREKTSIYLIENTNLLQPLKPDILTPYIGSLERKN